MSAITAVIGVLLAVPAAIDSLLPQDAEADPAASSAPTSPTSASEPESTPSPGGPALSVEAFTVAAPSSIDATQMDVSTGEEQPSTVDAEAIDITLENQGASVGLVTGIRISLDYADEIDNCIDSGGEVHVSAKYDVIVPTGTVEELPTELQQEVRFQIAPGALDRFTITVGPEDVSLSGAEAWLYGGTVALTKSDGTELQVGRFGVIAPSGQGLSNIENGVLSNAGYAEGEACLRDEIGQARELFERGGARSSELEAIVERYADY